TSYKPMFRFLGTPEKDKPTQSLTRDTFLLMPRRSKKPSTGSTATRASKMSSVFSVVILISPSSILPGKPERNKRTRSTRPKRKIAAQRTCRAKEKEKHAKRAEEPQPVFSIGLRSLRFLRNARIGFPHRLQKE